MHQSLAALKDGAKEGIKPWLGNYTLGLITSSHSSAATPATATAPAAPAASAASTANDCAFGVGWLWNYVTSNLFFLAGSAADPKAQRDSVFKNSSNVLKRRVGATVWNSVCSLKVAHLRRKHGRYVESTFVNDFHLRTASIQSEAFCIPMKLESNVLDGHLHAHWHLLDNPPVCLAPPVRLGIDHSYNNGMLIIVTKHSSAFAWFANVKPSFGFVARLRFPVTPPVCDTKRLIAHSCTHHQHVAFVDKASDFKVLFKLF